MRRGRLRPEIPGEEQHLGEQDRDRAELAHAPEPLHADLPDRRSTSCVARCITASSVASAPGELALQLAFAHHQDAIGQRQHFRQVARDHQARHARAPPARG